MKLKEIAKKIIPNIAIDKIRKVKETKQLYKVNIQNYDASNLLSFNKVDLKKIFRDEIILDSYISLQNELKTLDIPDYAQGVNPGDRESLIFFNQKL